MSRFDDCCVIYLHGFASGPGSSKAQFLKERLEKVGFRVLVPDLNGAGFENLTISGQLKIVEETVNGVERAARLLMMGSSMGGLLAVLASAHVERLRAMVLMAPGFGLSRRWGQLLGADQMRRWKETGTHDLFHYGLNKNMALGYQFIEDAQQLQTDELKVSQPTLVFHGKNDVTVPIAESIRFAELNPKSAELRILDDDHDLIRSLELIWEGTYQFFDNILCERAIGSDT